MNKIICFLHVLLCSINIFGMNQQIKTKEIKPDSFNDKGRLFIEHSVRLWHEAATQSGIHTGLAAIYNDIPANKPGIEALIYDAQSLKYANICNEYLLKQILHDNCEFLIKQAEKLTENLAQDLKRSIAQMIIYKKIDKISSGIFLPLNTLGFSCMSMEPEILSKILKANDDLNDLYEDNKYAARGMLLAMGYFMQDHIIDTNFYIDGHWILNK